MLHERVELAGGKATKANAAKVAAQQDKRKEQAAAKERLQEGEKERLQTKQALLAKMWKR